MLLQITTQSGHVPCVNKTHGTAKNRVFDSFVMRHIQLIGQRRFFNMPFQSCPALKTRFTSDGELRIAELQVSPEDFGIRGAMESRMKFPDALCRS